MGDTLVETHQTPIVGQPSTSRPQKKQKPTRKQRKEAEVSHDESEDEDHVPTHSSDLLPSGEDSYTLNELMVFCTNLQEHVFDLQEAKDAQSKEISALKKKVSKQLKWRKSRSRGLRRLMKIGSGRRVKSPYEKDSLGAPEDASKQGRMIEEIDQDDEIALDADTQGRKNDDEMFKVDDLSREEVVLDTTTGEHEEIEDVSTSEPVTTANEVVTTVADKQSHIPIVSSSKDKGKAKMIEPKVPIKKKDQIRMDEEYARQLEAEEQEAGRLSRAQQDEEANISWDNTQAMMEADNLLAKRLQAREREEFFDVEMRKINDFIAMDSEAQNSSGKEAQESSTKRTKEHLESDISKKQKVDENVDPVIDDTEDLKKCMEIVPDDGDEVLIEATPISSRSPTIIDYKIHKE
nr:hypothetical protein [Tanacetum cinerariifolium]